MTTSIIAENNLELPPEAADLQIVPNNFDSKPTWRKIQKCLRNLSSDSNFTQDISVFYNKVATSLEIENYLNFAFSCSEHPLYILKNAVQKVFERSYTGIGQHRELLPSALKEFGSFITRFFNLIKWIFPQLAVRNSQSSSAETVAAFVSSESRSQDHIPDRSFYTASSLISQHLLPGTCYSVLINLYKKSKQNDESIYMNKISKLNRQSSDLALLEYLGFTSSKLTENLNQNSTENPEACPSNNSISSQLSIAPSNLMLNISENLPQFTKILKTLEMHQMATQKLATLIELMSKIKEMQTSADELIPLLTFIIIRSKIEYLGCHLQFINDFLFQKLKSGEDGYCFTTMKSCYLFILKM